MKIKRVAKTKPTRILLLVFVLLTCISARAQENARLSKGTERIELKLTTKSEKACVGSFIPLELMITNHGNNDLQIRQLYVWMDFSIEYIDGDGSRKPLGMLGISPGTISEYERLRNEIHILKPEESYVTKYRLSLRDRRAFPEPGKYSLKSYYNRLAESNAINFEIDDCSSK